jgi:hypothetical protein
MAFQPTAALSFGAERPSYPVVDGDRLEPAMSSRHITATRVGWRCTLR